MPSTNDWVEHGKLASQYDTTEVERRHASLNFQGDKRSPFQKDRDRIIHCAAFRRLQGKTQVLGMGGSDFFRTRLTHSLEAAQIGKGIALHCGNANAELVEAACLAHDIGHPPFGHTGEDVLKEKMKAFGGFEGNAQNLRIITQLETRSAKQEGPGLNITRATLDAMLKYKTPYSRIDKSKPLDKWKFCYDADEELVKWASIGAPSGAKSFECQIMDWADDIAYSTHDLEDGIKSGMITAEKIDNRIEKNVKAKMEGDWNQDVWNDVISKIKDASVGSTVYEKKGKRRDLIASYIHAFITATSAKKMEGGSYPSRYQCELNIDHKQRIICSALKLLVWELIIDDERVATLARRATIIVAKLFDEFAKFEDGNRTREMYPLDFRERMDKAEDKEAKMRIACDFIAGMTDNYATRLYSRLTGGGSSSLMDIL